MIACRCMRIQLFAADEFLEKNHLVSMICPGLLGNGCRLVYGLDPTVFSAALRAGSRQDDHGYVAF
jgi:hypothetical protein